MDELRELLRLLEERLEQHDDSRKEVQKELGKLSLKIKKSAEVLEEKISERISQDFRGKEEGILSLVEKLKEGERSDLDALIVQAQEVLSGHGVRNKNLEEREESR